jgi:predicted transposase/invertase (TIGR01784 family)
LDKKPVKSHDKRFKELFSHTECILDLLSLILGKEMVSVLSENDIKILNNQFLQSSYALKEADMIYEIHLGDIIFCVLLELQSYVDFRMSLRLFFYMAELWRYYYNKADEQERSRKDYKLPAIIPCVFYNGRNRWTSSLYFKEIFKNPGYYGENLVNFKYALVDINDMDENAINSLKSKLTKVVFSLEKSKTAETFKKTLKEHLNDIKDLNEEESRILEISVRLMDFSRNYGTIESITELLHNDDKGVDNMLDTIIKNERKQARKEGKIEGKVEGKLEGRLEGRIEFAEEIARKMLMNGFDIESVMKFTELSKEQISKISL